MGRTKKNAPPASQPTTIEPKPVRKRAPKNVNASPRAARDGSGSSGPTVAEVQAFIAGLEPRIASVRETLAAGRSIPAVANRAAREAGELLEELSALVPTTGAARAFGEAGARLVQLRDLLERTAGGRL